MVKSGVVEKHVIPGDPSRFSAVSSLCFQVKVTYRTQESVLISYGQQLLRWGSAGAGTPSPWARVGGQRWTRAGEVPEKRMACSHCERPFATLENSQNSQQKLRLSRPHFVNAGDCSSWKHFAISGCAAWRKRCCRAVDTAICSGWTTLADSKQWKKKKPITLFFFNNFYGHIMKSMVCFTVL